MIRTPFRTLALLAFLVTFGAARADAQVTELLVEQGFDVTQLIAVPHVFCQNVTAGEYARSDVYSSLGSADPYTNWRCYSGGAHGLQISPIAGDTLEQIVHGKSDGVDVGLTLNNVTVTSVDCVNNTTGDVTTGSFDTATGWWICNLPSAGSTLTAGDNVEVTILGTY